MERPKLCKDWKNKVVRLNKTVVNNSGSVFHEGELIQVRSVNKHGVIEMFRPLGRIVSDLKNSDFDVIGDAKDIFRISKE